MIGRMGVLIAEAEQQLLRCRYIRRMLLQTAAGGVSVSARYLLLVQKLPAAATKAIQCACGRTATRCTEYATVSCRSAGSPIVRMDSFVR